MDSIRYFGYTIINSLAPQMKDCGVLCTVVTGNIVGIDGVWYCIREYYYSGRDAAVQKTDTEYADDLEKWLDGIKPQKIVVDPSAAFLMLNLRDRKSVV